MIRLTKKPEKKVLTPKDVAEYLGISETSARKFLKSGAIPGGFRAGNRHLIARENFNKYLGLTRSEK